MYERACVSTRIVSSINSASARVSTRTICTALYLRAIGRESICNVDATTLQFTHATHEWQWGGRCCDTRAAPLMDSPWSALRCDASQCDRIRFRAQKCWSAGNISCIAWPRFHYHAMVSVISCDNPRSSAAIYLLS